MVHKRKGFTLAELLVVSIIIGIMAAYAVPSYLKSVESGKADGAAAMMQQVAAANRMFFIDHQTYVTSGSLDTCSGATSCGTGTTPCDLVGCKYLASADFLHMPYDINAGCLYWGASDSAACAKRRTGRYINWGYSVDKNGNVACHGSGVPSPSGSSCSSAGS